MSRKKVHIQHEEEGGEAWLLPYSDLMTLLLAVFIVLFAVSQVDVKKAQAMSDEFTGTMMNQKYAQEKEEERIKNEGESGDEQNQDSSETSSVYDEMEELKSEIDSRLMEALISDFVQTYIDKRGLVVRMSNAILFEPGSAEIMEEHENAMMSIAGIISSIDNYIRIEGHTDSVPTSSGLYPSNWELSTARAISVVRLFVNEAGASPENFLAVGYGEYKPIADNGSEEGRAKNRRIDIIILSEENSNLER